MTVAHPTAGPLPAAARTLLTRAVVAALLATAALLVAWHGAYRSLEIRFAALLIDVLTAPDVYVVPPRQTVYFGLGTDHAIGLKITPECTSAFLVVPLLVIAAVMTGLRPRITRRVLAALAVAAAALVLVNQLRVLTLVALISSLGRDRGYYLGHTLLGSMVSVFGGAAALVLFVWLATRAPREDRSG